MRTRGIATRLRQIVAARARLGDELEALDRKGRTLVQRATLERERLAEEVETRQREERERAEAAEETRERREREIERRERAVKLEEERLEKELKNSSGVNARRGTFAMFHEEREQRLRQRAAAAGLLFVPPRIKFRQPRTIPEVCRAVPCRLPTPLSTILVLSMLLSSSVRNCSALFSCNSKHPVHMYCALFCGSAVLSDNTKYSTG